MAGKGLLDELDARLSEAEREAIATLAAMARRRRQRLFLAGGSVRDLLLGRSQVDLDISVEGDAIGLARELAQAKAGRLTAHDAFGTASVELAESRVDLARARAETYERPGALPMVRPASIDEDLRRRDFTVNAMALRLTPPKAGMLLDPCDGRTDLERRLIRVLHDRSFQDDATRMLRAVRYEGRLAFRIEGETERLLRRDLSYLDAISGARLWTELLLIFYEERPGKLLARCQELGILESIHPCLRFDASNEAAMARARGERPVPWDEVCLCLLCLGCRKEDVEALVKRLSLPRRQERALEDYTRLREALPKLSSRRAQPSEITETLEQFTPSAVWATALASENDLVGDRFRLFLRAWRYVKPFLGASALKRMGVPAGPEFGATLRRLRAARLDGETRSREEEIALLEKLREV